MKCSIIIIRFSYLESTNITSAARCWTYVFAKTQFGNCNNHVYKSARFVPNLQVVERSLRRRDFSIQRLAVNAPIVGIRLKEER